MYICKEMHGNNNPSTKLSCNKLEYKKQKKIYTIQQI